MIIAFKLSISADMMIYVCIGALQGAPNILLAKCSQYRCDGQVTEMTDSVR